MLSLTATELQRFMACNGFKSLNGIEPFNPSTEVTDEGNAAHWVAEQAHNGVDPTSLIGQTAPNGVFITDEMVDYLSDYIEFVTANKCDVEVDTSHNGNGWEIRGRADCIICNDDCLTVADLKYGWRIVEPVENWTLLSHAIGYCQSHQLVPYDVEFVIYQPRAYHPQGYVRKWRIRYTQLLDYYKQLCFTLENPSPTVVSGAQCYKCKSLSQCPAAQIALMNAIDIAQKAFDSEIDNATLAWMLNNIKRAQEILKQSYEAYQDLALHRLQEGKAIKGYTIQPSLGNTAWDSNVTVEFIKAMCGVDVSVSKLMTPAQAKKAGVPEELIKNCTHRPDNGLKLINIDENKIATKIFGDKK